MACPAPLPSELNPILRSFIHIKIKVVDNSEKELISRAICILTGITCSCAVITDSGSLEPDEGCSDRAAQWQPAALLRSGPRLLVFPT